MLKTILEKEKTTLIYQDATVPMVLALAGAGDMVIVFFLRQELPLGGVVVLGISTLTLWALAYAFFQRKSILIVDKGQQTIEEYVGKERRTFEFIHIAHADVDRVRESDTAQDDTEPSRSPHLNYHPFLQLKDPSEKYFLFDRGGRGLRKYREARTLVASVNEALSVEALKNLNVYQMKSKGETPFFYPVVVVVLLAAVIYLLLQQYGYL